MSITNANRYATLESQLGNEPCAVEDTEAMFWLREADDYQSRMALGDALSAQYRFREAIRAYAGAAAIRADDWKLLLRLAGAHLTLRHFKTAMDAYRRCSTLGASSKDVAYPMGIGYYLQREYGPAADCFAQCLPCGDELAVAVLYWHTLCCYRGGYEPSLLSRYHVGMEVGHHTAYRLAVSVFCGETGWEAAFAQLQSEKDDLNFVTALYGLCGYLHHIGKESEYTTCFSLLLDRNARWPCVPYLAAWNDAHSAAISAERD